MILSNKELGEWFEEHSKSGDDISITTQFQADLAKRLKNSLDLRDLDPKVEKILRENLWQLYE